MIELKENIITLCNKSGLPLEAIVFVLKDAYRDAERDFLIAREKEKESLATQQEIPKVEGEIVED